MSQQPHFFPLFLLLLTRFASQICCRRVSLWFYTSCNHANIVLTDMIFESTHVQSSNHPYVSQNRTILHYLLGFLNRLINKTEYRRDTWIVFQTHALVFRFFFDRFFFPIPHTVPNIHTNTKYPQHVLINVIIYFWSKKTFFFKEFCFALFSLTLIHTPRLQETGKTKKFLSSDELNRRHLSATMGK